jgi:hypothetical protein
MALLNVAKSGFRRLDVPLETAVVDRLGRQGPLAPRWPTETEWRELYMPEVAAVIGELLRWSEWPLTAERQRLARYEAEAKEFVEARLERIWQAPD